MVAAGGGQGLEEEVVNFITLILTVFPILATLKFGCVY